jgi:hypothetical protein
MDARQAVDRLFGRDPLAAEQALAVLSAAPPDAALLAHMLPIPAGRPRPETPGVGRRLARLARAWGPTIAPHLVRALRAGNWDTKLAAVHFFSGLHRDRAIEASLVAILEEGGDFDAEGKALEALGRLGADGWAWDVEHHARTGRWHRLETERRGEWSDYAYGKLWSCGVEGLTHMLARCTDRARIDTLVRLLDEVIQHQQEHLPNAGLSAVTFVIGLASELNERHVDPIVATWGEHADAARRQLCGALLAAIAPVRVAPFLLSVATDPAAPAEVRTWASVALGELRSRTVAEQLSRTLAQPGIDITELDFAASTLYAAGGEWSANPAFYQAVAGNSHEPGSQLRYALAVRGDARCREKSVADLDSKQSFVRWPAALALARLLGPDAEPLLRHRADAADNPLERAAMLAAEIRIGLPGRIDALHEQLQQVSSLSQLRTLWRMEIVDAFRCDAGGAPLFDAWRHEMMLNDRMLAYFDEWGRSAPAGAPAPAPAARHGAGTAPRVFVSYSHRDKVWLERFREMQDPLARQDLLAVWDDTRMVPGEWQPQIDAAMRQADVALFLVSSHFLASDFVNREELPELLRLAGQRGLRVVWVLLDVCLWETTPLAKFQGVNTDRPLIGLRNKAARQAIIKEAWLQVLGARDGRPAREDPKP